MLVSHVYWVAEFPSSSLESWLWTNFHIFPTLTAVKLCLHFSLIGPHSAHLFVEPAGICRYPMLWWFAATTSPCTTCFFCLICPILLSFLGTVLESGLYNQICEKVKMCQVARNGSKVQHLSRNTFTPPEISFLPIVAFCLVKGALSSQASCSSALGQLKWSPSLILAVRWHHCQEQNDDGNNN